MILPQQPRDYSVVVERERNRSMQKADLANRKKSEDIEVGDERLILTSPDGTRYSLTVDNAGTLSTTAL